MAQSKSNVMKKLNKQALSLGFFSILLGEYLLKQKAVVIKPNEWKFMAIIARNATFKEHLGQINAQFGSNMAKNSLFSIISL